MEKTVRLKEADDFEVATPKPIIKLSKAKIMQDSSKFRKLSTTDQIEGLLSSQRSILDGIVDASRNNDFVEDKHKNSNKFQTKLDISEEKSNISDDNNSSQTRYSIPKARWKK